MKTTYVYCKECEKVHVQHACALAPPGDLHLPVSDDASRLLDLFALLEWEVLRATLLPTKPE